MARQMPPLTWFRAFEAAARHLSFTAAAGELGLTQSAVSQHVRSLEQRFGVTLFRRHARGITLTDDGRRLLPDVSRAIDALSSVSQAYDNRADNQTLTIAASVSITQWYLAPGIAAFQRAWPDLSIRFISATWPDEFNTRLADVEIRFGAAALVGQDARLLGPDALIVIAAPTVAAGAGLSLGLGLGVECLAAQPLIQPVGTSDNWEHWSRHTGIEVPAGARLQVDSHGLAVDLTRRGAGVALTSSLIAAPSLLEGAVARLDLPSAPSIDGYHLAVNSTGNPAARAFADWFGEAVRSQIEKLP